MRRAVLLIALVGAGCDNGIAFKDLAAAQHEATCDYYTRCGVLASRADCDAIFPVPDNASLEAAINAAKVEYDGTAAEDCIDAVDELSCNLTEQDPDSFAACDDIYRGRVTIGSACAFDLECGSRRCVVPNCPDACCQGTCEVPRPLPGLDEPCSTVCADELYCGIDQICHAYLGAGEPCSPSTVCDEPLYCSSSSGTCAERTQHGEPCDDECAEQGDICNGTCVEAGLAGDPCATSYDCSYYYICNVEAQTCELPPSILRSPNGTPCTGGNECSSGYCDAVCAAPPICY